MATVTFDELYETLPGNGWLSKDEARLLYGAAQTTTGPILEVGCYEGRSTCLLGSTGRVLHAVDPWDQREHHFKDTPESADKCYAAFMSNIQERKLTNVVTWRCRIEDWHPVWCGFAYLDGCHTAEGTMAQLAVVTGMAPKMGGVCVHDVNDDGEGKVIRDVCLQVLGPWKMRCERLAWWDLGGQSHA